MFIRAIRGQPALVAASAALGLSVSIRGLQFLCLKPTAEFRLNGFTHWANDPKSVFIRVHRCSSVVFQIQLQLGNLGLIDWNPFGIREDFPDRFFPEIPLM